MKETRNENNVASIIGEIVSEFTFSHEVFGEKFYKVYVSSKRLSEQFDIIPLMISERLINIGKNCRGKIIEVIGQFRSYSRHDGKKSRLSLSVFAREINFLENFTDCTKSNHIFLEGYICKSPIYRKTPAEREITDILLAVNRPYGKSDYIPCITWGRTAVFTSSLEVGSRIKINGRVQSREYSKKLNDFESETRIAYEVSVSRLEVIEDDANSNQ